MEPAEEFAAFRDRLFQISDCDLSLERLRASHSLCLDWLCETISSLDKTADNAIKVAMVAKLLSESMSYSE